MIDLPAALTAASMTVSGVLFGTLGIVLGTPLAALGMTSVRTLRGEVVLEHHTADAP